MSADPRAIAADLSPAQARVLRRALSRGGDHPLCPTTGLHAAAQTAVLDALARRGLADGTPGYRGRPRLTPAGIGVAHALVAHGKGAA